jgi:YVTN family beta-propeller protein
LGLSLWVAQGTLSQLVTAEGEVMLSSSLSRAACITSFAALLGACGGGEPDSGDAQGQRERGFAVPAGATAEAATKGMFGPLKSWPLIAVHGVLTSDGRVLSYGTKGDGQQTAYFIYDVWNPVDDTHLTAPNGTGVDIFCSSQLLLPSGNSIVISGGDNWIPNGAGGGATNNQPNNKSTVFDVSSSNLTAGNNMNRQRWYSTSTMLLNGEIYVQGGTGGTDFPEIRGSTGSYRLLTTAGTGAFHFMYPRNFIAPDGRVFGYDSAGKMYFVDTAGTGAVTTAGQFAGNTGDDSSAAMFAPGRILQYGGSSNTAVVIDINGPSPVVTPTSALLRQRRLSSATILADGKVVATGGSSVWNQMTNVSYEAEIWNPQTGSWTVGASAVKARLYHGNALLLPDATVLVFGGGAPGPQNNTNAEIYYPPYLFAAGGAEAVRPVLSSAPSVVNVGRTVQLGVSSARPISRVTFVKTGSATHGWNMDQRFVDLPFNVLSASSVAVQIPGLAASVPPGMWMMFVIDDAGVPSLAKMVRVDVANQLKVNVVPVLTSPGNQSSTVGTAVALQVVASDPNNGDVLRYSASGLPPGLSINAASGAISGTPSAAGTFTVGLAVTDGVNGASATITWSVAGAVQPWVLNPPPAAAPSTTGSSVTFGASASGSNLQYRWDFGDGSAPTGWSTSPTASHTFASPGVFFVTVTAMDTAGVQQNRTLIHSVYLTPTSLKPSISSSLLLEPRSGANTRLWVANPDNDSVTVFDAQTRAKLAEIPVGTAPRTLALAPDGGSVWVVNQRSASVSVISTATLAVSRTTPLARGSQPYGIAFAAGANGAALVTLEASGALVKIDAAGAVSTPLPMGPNPRHVSVAGDGTSAFVSRFITPPLPGESTAAVATTLNGVPVGGEVVVVDAAAMSVTKTIVLAHSDLADAENGGRGVPNYLGAASISPDGTQAFVPSKLDNIKRGGRRDGLPLNFQNTVRAVSSRIAMASRAEELGARIDHDNASMASAAVFDALGVYLFVALETSREVAVLDAHTRNQLMRIDVGRAPQALAVSADRRTLYVSNFMDRTVGVFDLSPLVQQGVVGATPLATLATVVNEKLTAQVLRGKQFFYDARDTRLSRDRYMSCASCHNDGGHDGRVWDLSSQGEGLRNTVSLRGRASLQGFLHWSNNFDEVQDFEGQIRTLAGGTGLMTDAQFNTGTRSQPLGEPKAGVSTDLDALAAYVASLNSFEPSPARPSSSTLSPSASSGKTLFMTMNCASCHAGTGFTRSAINNPSNIGTIKATSGQRLSGPLTGIDVPTLRDVWNSAPYLHDGSAPTLQAAIRAHNSFAGAANADLDLLASYLREIGSDETTAPLILTAGSGTGLVGRYYGGTSLGGGVLLTRTEAVDMDWASGAPGPGVPSDNFSVRWSGTFTVPSSGPYLFRTIADDGARVWVGGVRRINDWNAQSGVPATSAAVSLTAGDRVPIVLEYFDKKGQATVRLQWQIPGSNGFVAMPVGNLNPN